MNSKRLNELINSPEENRQTSAGIELSNPEIQEPSTITFDIDSGGQYEKIRFVYR